MLLGEPVYQVKALQELIKPGEILVTPKAWFYAPDSHFNYQYIREHRCYKVVSFKDNLQAEQRQQESILEFHEMERMMDMESFSSFTGNASYEPTYDREMALSAGPKIEIYTRKLILGLFIEQ